MKAKRLYKTTIKVEVLSDEPIPEHATIDSIYEDITYGSSSGRIIKEENNTEIEGEKAVKECEKHGTDPDFFMMDYNGNEINEG